MASDRAKRAAAREAGKAPVDADSGGSGPAELGQAGQLFLTREEFEAFVSQWKLMAERDERTTARLDHFEQQYELLKAEHAADLTRFKAFMQEQQHSLVADAVVQVSARLRELTLSQALPPGTPAISAAAGPVVSCEPALSCGVQVGDPSMEASKDAEHARAAGGSSALSAPAPVGAPLSINEAAVVDAERRAAEAHAVADAARERVIELERALAAKRSRSPSPEAPTEYGTPLGAVPCEFGSKGRRTASRADAAASWRRPGRGLGQPGGRFGVDPPSGVRFAGGASFADFDVGLPRDQPPTAPVHVSLTDAQLEAMLARFGKPAAAPAQPPQPRLSLFSGELEQDEFVLAVAAQVHLDHVNAHIHRCPAMTEFDKIAYFRTTLTGTAHAWVSTVNVATWFEMEMQFKDRFSGPHLRDAAHVTLDTIVRVQGESLAKHHARFLRLVSLSHHLPVAELKLKYLRSVPTLGQRLFADLSYPMLDLNALMAAAERLDYSSRFLPGVGQIPVAQPPAAKSPVVPPSVAPAPPSPVKHVGHQEGHRTHPPSGFKQHDKFRHDRFKHAKVNAVRTDGFAGGSDVSEGSGTESDGSGM